MKIVLTRRAAVFASRQRSAQRHVRASVVQEEVDDVGRAGISRVRDAGAAVVIEKLHVGVGLLKEKENQIKKQFFLGFLAS